MKELPAILDELLGPRAEPRVLATLVHVEGSSYRRPGARILISAKGSRVGSISGGCLEEDVIARSHRVLATGKPDAVVYDTTSENDLVWGVGLGCHGVVRVLLERLEPQPSWAKTLALNFTRRRATALAVRYGGEDDGVWGTRLAAPGDCDDPGRLFLNDVAPPPALIIFGAGDDAQPLARLACELGWHVTIADVRPAFATSTRFPTAYAIVVGPVESLVEKVAPSRDALAVIMTHHYVHDLPLLRTLIGRPLRYLGLLGPKKRADKIVDDLKRGGQQITDEERARLHAPVGLDLGADSPEQVALSIVAEIQSVLAQRNAQPLHRRELPIHA